MPLDTTQRSLAHPADPCLTHDPGKRHHLHGIESQLATQRARNGRGGCFCLGMCVRAERALRSTFAAFRLPSRKLDSRRAFPGARPQDVPSSSALGSAPAGHGKSMERVILQLETLQADQDPGASPASNVKVLDEARPKRTALLCLQPHVSRLTHANVPSGPGCTSSTGTVSPRRRRASGSTPAPRAHTEE